MIFNIIIQTNGDTDNVSRNVFIITDSTYDQVITSDFLKQTNNIQFYESDLVNVLYDYSDISKSGTNGKFTISFSGFTLILLPVFLLITIPVTSTSKILSFEDQDTIQDCSNSSSQTIVVPSYSSVPFIFGIPISFKRSGVGSVTFSSSEGVTIQSENGNLKIASQYSQAYLMPMNQNIFWLYGDLSS